MLTALSTFVETHAYLIPSALIGVSMYYAVHTLIASTERYEMSYRVAVVRLGFAAVIALLSIAVSSVLK